MGNRRTHRLLLLDLVDLDPHMVVLEVLFPQIRPYPSITLEASIQQRARTSGKRTELNENWSPGLTSRPFGCLTSTRTLPHARDWSVRLSSFLSAYAKINRHEQVSIA